MQLYRAEFKVDEATKVGISPRIQTRKRKENEKLEICFVEHEMMDKETNLG